MCNCKCGKPGKKITICDVEVGVLCKDCCRTVLQTRQRQIEIEFRVRQLYPEEEEPPVLVEKAEGAKLRPEPKLGQA